MSNSVERIKFDGSAEHLQSFTWLVLAGVEDAEIEGDLGGVSDCLFRAIDEKPILVTFRPWYE